ncbi:MAG: hypothetical protein GX075_01415 [Firmicutes bacterium]|nr:hypothetical protein [Bacillota bacterium]
MNCYNARKYLEELAAGEISSPLARRLQEHLRSCPGCREEYQMMKQALELMRSGQGIESRQRFNSVWRQRVRQEAIIKEAGRRGFFAVFKTNTLIPALGVLAVALVFVVFSIFNRFVAGNQVKETALYQLRIMDFGPDEERVREVIAIFDQYREEYRDGGVPPGDSNREGALLIYQGLTEEDLESFKLELEKAGAKVEFGKEGK